MVKTTNRWQNTLISWQVSVRKTKSFCDKITTDIGSADVNTILKKGDSMKKISKRILALILASMFCLTALIGCKKEEEGDGGTPSDSSPNDTSAPSDTLNDADTLGDYDFKGAEYKILARESTLRDFNDSDPKGVTVINNAVFSRNEAVASRFNVKIKVEKTDGDWQTGAGNEPSGSAFSNKYQQITMSGWSEYSLVSAHMAMQTAMSVNGFTRDLTTLESVDMQKEWWSKPFYDACNIEGKFYVALGDITYSMYDYMEVIFFNETMAEQYLKDASGNPINLYDVVKSDDGWTWEKFVTYTKMVSYNQDDPEYGLATNDHAVRTFLMAMDVTVSQKNSSTGLWEFPKTLSEKTGRFDDVADFVSKTQNVYFKIGDKSFIENGNDVFNAGDALFYSQHLSEVVSIGEHLKNGQTFGVLPFPKYDEDQIEYLTTMRDTTTAITVPRNIQDLTMVGVVTEALCMYGYQNVRPTYFDTVVKGRYLTDSNMRDMLDLCRKGVTSSFDMMYSASMEYPYSTAIQIIHDNVKFASYYEKNQSKWDSYAKQIYTALGVSS